MITYQIATNETFACNENKILRFKDYSSLPYNKALITNNKLRQLYNQRPILRSKKYEEVLLPFLFSYTIYRFFTLESNKLSHLFTNKILIIINS